MDRAGLNLEVNRPTTPLLLSYSNSLLSRATSSHYLLDEEESEQTFPPQKIFRPSFFLLRILGLWQPADCHFFWNIYQRCLLLVCPLSLASQIGIDFIHYRNDPHYGEIINGIGTSFDLICPYIFTRYYFSYGQFDTLVSSVMASLQENDLKKLRRISRLYTAMSIILWVLVSAFFIEHWELFLKERWQVICYVIVAVITVGWWACWLSLYGFVCHVHSWQISVLNDIIEQKEKTTVQFMHLLHKVQESLDRTQKDFHVIVSFAVSYHLFDMIVLSIAYFNGDFGKKYSIWQYAGGMSFDILSLIMKLYPAALVATSVHQIVKAAAKNCRVGANAMEMPVDQILFLEYVVRCESDMGFRILGIRITVALASRVFITLATIMLSVGGYLLK